MIIERNIKINKINYLLGIEINYKDNGSLCKKDGSYFDLGDLSLMIEYVEKNYNKSVLYDKNITFMNNVIYLYNQFPFLNYIKEVTYTKENKISKIMYISKQEILNYIKKNNIKLDKFNENTCICPLLYK